MENIQTLAARAESEIDGAKQQCKSRAYDSDSRSNLWDVFRRWVDHPQSSAEFNALEFIVLNELQSSLSNENLSQEGWSLVVELARRWHREDNVTRKEAMRIAIFEIAAEPPEFPGPLQRLFSLASEPETRWAVFAAYEKFPWRLRPHAKKYSGGAVTDDDCDHWLTTQGLYQDEILMNRTRDDIEAMEIYFEASARRCQNAVTSQPTADG